MNNTVSEELFPLVDEDGNVIGQSTRTICHNGSRLLHPVIHLHIFNSKGELFLQKRSATKDIQPNKWDTAVGGHIDLGETPEIAVYREAREELGILDINPIYVQKYIIDTKVEVELTYCYYAIYDGNINIDQDEVVDGRFWSIEEIESSLNKDIFTINFESDFDLFLKRGLPSLL